MRRLLFAIGMSEGGEELRLVSEEGKIVNPYLGQSMPTCGSVKDTLKAEK